MERKAKKTYALALDDDGHWVGGSAWGYPTQELADKQALLECNDHRLEKKASKASVKYTCKAIQRNDVALKTVYIPMLGTSTHAGHKYPCWAQVPMLGTGA